jgi:putative hydrolase of the HAD superfamily
MTRNYDAALFDIRCVSIDPYYPFNDQPFAPHFAHRQSIDPKSVTDFVRSEHEFRAALAGKRPLAEVVTPHLNEWQWQGSAKELIRYWCRLECGPNAYTLKCIRQLRQIGVSCYLTANLTSEQSAVVVRGPLKNAFDGSFLSHELGAAKPDPEYYENVLKQLALNGIERHRAVLFERSLIARSAVPVANSKHPTLEQDCYIYQSPEQALAIAASFQNK